MKTCLILSLLLAANIAMAEEANKDKPQLTVPQIKEKMLKGFDKRIEALKEAKSCVKKAESKDAIKECRRALGKKMKEHKEKFKQEKDKLKTGSST